MAQAIVKLEQVTKKYGKRTILNHFSMTVNHGDFAALIGPSGSGKSTILNIIGLLEQFDSGSYLLNNKSAPGVNSRKATLARRNDINYLFQTFALISNMTVRQNLKLALNFSRVPKNKTDKQIADILAEVGLQNRLDDTVATMSVGEKQRVALARAFLKPGELILADEPTGSLDPQLALHVLKLIQKLQHEHHKTIIMVTHDMKLAQAADYQIVLKKGQ
ncbi:ABC transporter ATP-binding protein [Lactobacillus helsingborgensis]|uniref:ABC transporter ATP-binding protein n=1 Tax=Lactobacillus helsingborgensis TaxID=1218494 RepID=UPI00165072BF|nr:ABC transporter ATP-binding protein [Lactobacillus helsingborgensis]MBC6356823.1 ABC transporter ATP-binding protein [Lactobacillus helsingborgensis]